MFTRQIDIIMMCQIKMQLLVYVEQGVTDKQVHDMFVKHINSY